MVMAQKVVRAGIATCCNRERSSILKPLTKTTVLGPLNIIGLDHRHLVPEYVASPD